MVKPERSGVKAEAAGCPARSVKAEAVKAEHKVKVEAGVKKQEPVVKKQEPVVKKQESPVKREAKVAVDGLVARGMALRAKAEQSRKVKKEGRAKAKRKPAKRKATAKRRNASREAMNRPVALSEDLASMLGDAALSRPETVRRIWAYSKDRNLLNPSNKREILCDTQLKQILGAERACLTDLQKLLMPHFDYSSPVPQSATAVKKDGNQKVKKAEVPKAEVKRKLEELEIEKQEMKEEKKVKVKQKEEAAPVKRETAPSEALAASAETASREISARLTGLWPNALTMEFSSKAIYPQNLEFRLVACPSEASGSAAAPVGSASASVGSACAVSSVEGDQGFESRGCGRLEGLAPDKDYSAFVEVACGGAAFRSASLRVPQRQAPTKWSAHEVQLWAAAVQVPEFARKLAEYCVDGATLLTFEEADLRGLGLSAPFLVRRVLAAIQALR